MPVLYRSRSVRRFDENTNRLTSLIENDSIKVLATASVQLFISTPNLDKWFKSSTGTLCFLKDFHRKNFFFFKLFSLMQGQLWEQEMESPFVYGKLSNVFHYLAVNKFNFGFRFICEDEAERFYSVITKMSTIETSQSPNKLSSKSSQMNSNSSPSALGSIANAAAAVAVMANPNHSSSTTTLTNWSTTDSTTTASIKAVARYVCSPDSSEKKRSRRPTQSADRKKIDKRDISCPFRCSCVDLHLNKTPSSSNLSNNIALNTPSTPTITASSKKNFSHRLSYCNTYQTMTPISANSKPPADNKTPNKSSSTHANKSKSSSKTPSPQYELFKQSLFQSSNTPNSIDNAPPKPPRRISLLLSNYN